MMESCLFLRVVSPADVPKASLINLYLPFYRANGLFKRIKEPSGNDL
jgi:hypothetical protein